MGYLEATQNPNTESDLQLFHVSSRLVFTRSRPAGTWRSLRRARNKEFIILDRHDDQRNLAELNKIAAKGKSFAVLRSAAAAKR